MALGNRYGSRSARTKVETSRSRWRTEERCHFRSAVDVGGAKQNESTVVVRQEAAPVRKDGMAMAVILFRSSQVAGPRHCDGKYGVLKAHCCGR
jgi:hypothetical protein